jgi:hypothetical protein
MAIPQTHCRNTADPAKRETFIAKGTIQPADKECKKGGQEGARLGIFVLDLIRNFMRAAELGWDAQTPD